MANSFRLLECCESSPISLCSSPVSRSWCPVACPPYPWCPISCSWCSVSLFWCWDLDLPLNGASLLCKCKTNILALSMSGRIDLVSLNLDSLVLNMSTHHTIIILLLNTLGFWDSKIKLCASFFRFRIVYTDKFKNLFLNNRKLIMLGNILNLTHFLNLSIVL